MPPTLPSCLSSFVVGLKCPLGKRHNEKIDAIF